MPPGPKAFVMSVWQVAHISESPRWLALAGTKPDEDRMMRVRPRSTS
ncbi:MAG: hypothetical protein MUF60_11595 [Vicinamibacterales bacterium]|nr:hypothetical protein [Vicinamibacterales bacterium]